MAKRKTDLEGKTTVANKNANGEGTIYQITSGPKKGQFCCEIRRPKRKVFYGKTKSEVKNKRDNFLEQHHLSPNADEVRHMTFGDWLLQYMTLYKKPPVIRLSTHERYMDDINNQILPALGDIYLVDLESSQIQAFYNKIEDAGHKPHKVHQIINQCLDQAVQERKIPWNPDKATKLPKVEQREAMAMDDKSFDRFRTLIDTLSDMWRAAFLVLLGTGLRIGEVLALEWLDVNLEAGTLFVRTTVNRTKAKGLDIGDPKTKKSKASVPIPSVTLESLKRHKSSQAQIALSQGKRFRIKADHNKLMKAIYEEYPRLDSYSDNPKKCKCPEEECTELLKDKKRKIFRCERCGREWQRINNNPVFPSILGTIMSPRNFQRKFYRLLEEAKCEHINLHGLRHTFATKLIEEGEDIRIVQALLRHAPGSKATAIYAHVTPKAERKGSNRINDVLTREIAPENQI